MLNLMRWTPGLTLDRRAIELPVTVVETKGRVLLATTPVQGDIESGGSRTTLAARRKSKNLRFQMTAKQYDEETPSSVEKGQEALTEVGGLVSGLWRMTRSTHLSR